MEVQDLNSITETEWKGTGRGDRGGAIEREGTPEGVEPWKPRVEKEGRDNGATRPQRRQVRSQLRMPLWPGTTSMTALRRVSATLGTREQRIEERGNLSPRGFFHTAL